MSGFASDNLQITNSLAKMLVSERASSIGEWLIYSFLEEARKEKPAPAPAPGASLVSIEFLHA